MKTGLLIFFAILFFLQTFLARAGELNVALRKPISIQYAGSAPANSKYADPNTIVDGTTATYLFIDPKSSGKDNSGTFVTLSLGHSFSVSRFRIRQYFDQLNLNTRVRGYRIQTSDDSLRWDTIVDLPDNSAPTPDTTLANSVAGKYVRLVVTKVAEETYQAIIGEFEVYADISVPAIVSFSFGASTLGKGYRGISWTSMNMNATDSVNIYCRPIGIGEFQPLALNEANDGGYDWKTDVIADGVYEIKLVPVTAGPSLAFSGVCTFISFTSLSINEQFGYCIDAQQQPPYPPPPFYSSMLGDTVRFSWSYQREYMLPYGVRLSYSTDNKNTWTPIVTLTDTTLRSWDWVMTNPATSGAFGFLQMAIIQNGVVVNASSTTRAMAFASMPPGVSLLWKKDEKSVRPFPRVLPPLLAYSDGATSSILLDKQWAVYGNGDSVSGMSMTGPSTGINTMAGGSVSAGGQTGFFYGSSNDESAQFSDLDGNGIDEYFYGSGAAIVSFRPTGEPLNMYATPGTSGIHCSATDIDGDHAKELIFTDPSAGSLAAVTTQGVSKKDFPVKLIDAPQSWTLAADLDGDGIQSIITSSPSHLFVLNADGTMRKGFPLQTRGAIANKTPVLADINNDGTLDIIFLTTLDSYATLFGINIIDPDGNALAGWPDTISTQLYEYPGRFYHPAYSDTFSSRFSLPGRISSPLVVSMDGGRRLNIVMSCSNGFLYVLNTDGSPKNGYPMYAGCDGGETGVFGDFDGNGTLNYVYHTYPDLRKPGKVVCLDFGPGSYSEKHMPWPMYLQNARRSGIAPKPYPLNIQKSASLLPSEFALDQNYPNPFNPATTISYSIAEQCRVRLEVFDVLGRMVATLADEFQSAGTRMLRFDASQLSSGIYFYRLNAGNYSAVKKLVVQK